MALINSIYRVMLMLVCSSLAVNALAKVSVNINQQQLHFEQEVRLEQVLQPVAFSQNWYWPASKLYNTNNLQPILQRQDLLKQLAKRGLDAKHSQKAAQSLINQLKSWQLAHRIPIPIHYELARYSFEHNPLFNDGEYLLNLQERPADVFVFGALETPGTRPYANNRCVQSMLENVNRLEDADHDYVYVIYPDAQIRKLGVAYWNSQCDLIMPGSQVFIPLAESQLSSDTTHLNQAIAQLATHRVFAQ